MAPNEIYIIQPAFTGGEISPDVASRVDLDKYQRALLQAENAIIRPYGAVRKRPGTIFCGHCKYDDKKTILYRFDFSVDISYLLEIGWYYIRVWRNGVFLDVELNTPYEEEDLPKLRFVQSIDVLYICSGRHPVMKLLRYAELNWQFREIDWKLPAFGEINEDESLTLTPSGINGNITLTASKSYFTTGMVGEWIKLCHSIANNNVNGSCAPNKTVEIGPFGNEITTTTTGEWTSGSIVVGDSWKVITHGTWAGSVNVETSLDNGTTWMNERTYTGNNDYNPTETGVVEKYCLMRVRTFITSGTCTVDFSSLPYTHEGYVKITSVASATLAYATVMDEMLGKAAATDEFYGCAWGSTKGYPNCATFFQDRLCFGGSEKYPQRVWMSRSGDYENFSVDKEDGTVTDDSAVTANLLSLKTYTISHMSAGNDLVILTDGNEWTISGSESVTPSSITPKNQQNNGCADILPIRINNRLIYVQRRGSIVRDIGYNYDTDSYVGADLTLLAKHLIRDKELVSGCYQQEPDSIVYFVRADGIILALSYIAEQNVYAWSRIVTDGSFEAMASCQQGNNDVVYTIVKRNVGGEEKRYIERMDTDHDSNDQQDYVMLDASIHYKLGAPATDITGLWHLEGKKVSVMADGYLFEEKTVAGGTVVLPEGARDIIIGLPYTMKLEQPNLDIGNGRDGTIQGRQKAVSYATMRLYQSFGGAIGPDEDHLNKIVYETGWLELGSKSLYTGDKRVTLTSGGFNSAGRVFIKHEKPYPFNLGAIIRTVTLGG